MQPCSTKIHPGKIWFSYFGKGFVFGLVILCHLVFNWSVCLGQKYAFNGLNKDLDEIPLVEDQDNCERGQAQAFSDIKKGNLGLNFYGLPSPEFYTWQSIIVSKLQLKIFLGGCVESVEGHCYNEIMEKHIRERYGDQVFGQILDTVNRLYEEGMGDRDAKFGMDESDLQKYIYCQLNSELLSSIDHAIPIVVAQLNIDRTGKPHLEKIVFRNIHALSDCRYENEVMCLVEQMPNWEPAIENRKHVNSRYAIPVLFDLKMYDWFCQH